MLVALHGGAVSGFLVVALSLLGVTIIYLAYGGIAHPELAPQLIVGFGFGASFVALFAQLGGGIYTKAADMGADLVGKVEAGFPEDDPRNAAVIADLVGDNVGDCAGRGADLFESTAAESIGAMILATVIYAATKNVNWILFPLVVRAFGLLASMAGILTVNPRNDEDPMKSLNRGYYVAIGLSVAVAARVPKPTTGPSGPSLEVPLWSSDIVCWDDIRPHKRRGHHPNQAMHPRRSAPTMTARPMRREIGVSDGS